MAQYEQLIRFIALILEAKKFTFVFINLNHGLEHD